MDAEALARAVLDLRERYPDPDEFEAALRRLADELNGGEPPAPGEE